MFCVARAVHEFDFWPVINETPNEWWPVERSRSDEDVGFWLDLFVYVYLPPSPQVLTDSNHAAKVNWILLSKGD